MTRNWGILFNRLPCAPNTLLGSSCFGGRRESTGGSGTRPCPFSSPGRCQRFASKHLCPALPRSAEPLSQPLCPGARALPVPPGWGGLGEGALFPLPFQHEAGVSFIKAPRRAGGRCRRRGAALARGSPRRAGRGGAAAGSGN